MFSNYISQCCLNTILSSRSSHRNLFDYTLDHVILYLQPGAITPWPPGHQQLWPLPCPSGPLAQWSVSLDVSYGNMFFGGIFSPALAICHPFYLYLLCPVHSEFTL